MTLFAEKQRLVLKIGSALLVDPDTGALRQDWLNSLCEDIHTFHQHDYEIIVVSSGAVALARHQTNYMHQRLKLGEKQALASIGQVGIANAWQQALAQRGLMAAQVLLTPDDTEDRKRHLNARRTIDTILSLGAVPVINENDTLSTEELRFGDNDRLAARIAQMLNAKTLILFSDIDGLYSADPRTNPEAKHISIVEHITDDIMAAGGDAPSAFSSGGMRTKLQAAQIATRADCDMIITKGERLHPLSALQNGALHTRFLAQPDCGSARKRWIASTLRPEGSVSLDKGAVDALQHGASVLSAGVTHIEGHFDDGAVVALTLSNGETIGYGVIDYNDEQSRAMLGHRSTESDDQDTQQRHSVMIHRNNLALETPMKSK